MEEIEKQTLGDWECDCSKGHVQCTAMVNVWGTEYFCRYRQGHPGLHKTCSGNAEWKGSEGITLETAQKDLKEGEAVTKK